MRWPKNPLTVARVATGEEECTAEQRSVCLVGGGIGGLVVLTLCFCFNKIKLRFNLVYR